MKQSPKLPAEKRQAQLIGAAIEVFNRKGYNGATTEDIAREAGVTKGAIYFHFKSKEDIFMAVVRETAGRQMQGIVDYLKQQPDANLFIESIVKYTFEMLNKEKQVSVEVWEQAHKIKRIQEYMAKAHEKMVNEIAHYMKKNGGISLKKAKSLVWIMHAIWDGMLVQKFCYHGQVDHKEMMKQIISMYQLYLNKHKAMHKV